jgi:hypothetical protein
MQTKAEDVRKVARLRAVVDGLRRMQEFESAKYLDEYADLLDQQAKGEPVGEIICPMDEGYQRVGTYGEEIALGTLLYAHPLPDQAEPTVVSDEDVASAFQEYINESGIVDSRNGDLLIIDNESMRAALTNYASRKASITAQAEPVN